MNADLSTPNPLSRPVVVGPAVWGLILLAIALLSVLGLLQIRVSAYDDSSLLLGARLLRNGQLPYVDFYTPYGPLGYSLVATALSLNNNFGLALRAFQGILLVASIAFLLWMGRKGPSGSLGLLGGGGVALSAFLMTNVFWQPPFLGFTFCLASLAMVCLSRAAPSRALANLAAGGGGVALACAVLIRPVFAGYALLGIVAVELAGRGRPNREPGDAGRPALFLVALLLSLPLIWILLYPRVSPAAAIEASILIPSRVFSGGQRGLDPGHLLPVSSSALAAWLGPLMAAVVAMTLASFVIAARRAAARALVPATGLLGALGALALRGSSTPGSRVALVAAVLALVGLAATFLMKTEIRDS
ncbi:MAG TPA: hypothetical protein VKG01_12835, partial [Thermoanaerobaculia bacterium]|nr:hypothetical protein [Thermoanaerobaculia bacterium]